MHGSVDHTAKPKGVPQCSATVCSLLFDVEAVKISVEKPFRLTSGRLSPVYFDCRRLMLSPAAMRLVASLFAYQIQADGIDVSVIAGGESAGIPFAAYLACLVAKPMVYVRKAPREHGTASQVEGGNIPEAKTLLVEDLITDGASKLGFVEGLRSAGFVVEHCFVVLDRDQGGSDLLAQHGVRLLRLTTAKETLAYALERGVISRPDYDSTLAYLDDPVLWSQQHE